MATLDKARRRIRWYDHANGKRRTRTFARLDDAISFQIEVERHHRLIGEGVSTQAIATGRDKDRPIAALVQEYLTSIGKPATAATEHIEQVRTMPRWQWKDAEARLAEFVAYRAYGFRPLEMIRELDQPRIRDRLESFLRQYGNGSQARRTNDVRRQICGLSKYAHNLDLIDVDQASKARVWSTRKDAPKVVHRPATVEEAEDLGETPRGDQYAFRFATALRGQTVGKLLAADFRVWESTYLLTLRPGTLKNLQTEAILPIAPRLAPMLQRLLARPWPTDLPIFQMADTHDERLKQLRRDLKEAQVDYRTARGAFNGRSFRMTANTWQMACGIQPETRHILRIDVGADDTRLIRFTYTDWEAQWPTLLKALVRVDHWYDKQVQKLQRATA